MSEKRFTIRLSYRWKLGAQFFGLTLLTIGGLTTFFLTLYSRDKLAGAYERELSNAVQAAQYLENALLLAKDATPEQVRTSPAIIFSLENPCGGGTLEAVSQHYATTLDRLKLVPRVWLKSPQLTEICKRKRSPGEVTILQNFSRDRTYPAPAVLALLDNNKGGHRLVFIAMESFTSGASGGTLALVDREGMAVWSNNSGELLKQASDQAEGMNPFQESLRAVDAEVDELAMRAEQVLSQGLPTAIQMGEGGIAAMAPVLSRWALVALASETAILRPVRFLVKQAFWLTAGFFFLCLLAAKLIADRVSRPLRDLSNVAQEFGKGNLAARIEVTQGDEFGVLQGTFNLMAGKIERLLEETRTRALLEADVQLAQRVQEMLIPDRKIELRGHEIHSFVKMADKCGGDWWGYIDVPSGSPLLLVLIGDVTGHGISSALLTAAAQGGASVVSSWVHLQPDVAKDPRFLLKLFNRAVYDAARGAVQMSFFSAVIDINAQMLYASNAAHNWPYLISKKEGTPGVSVTTVGCSSPVLGQSPDTDFTEIVSVPWKPGYQLFLYTDGLIDAYKDEKNAFDRRALIRILRETGGMTGSALLQKVLKARNAATTGIPQEDDITAVVCHWRTGA